MPLYDFVCAEKHRWECVRPIDTDSIVCPVCEGVAFRWPVNHFHVVGPTVNSMGKADDAHDYMLERDYAFKRFEADVDEPVGRPNDWARPKWEAQERLRRGEIPADVLKNDETAILTGRQR